MKKELYVLGDLRLDLESPDETKEHALERLIMKCMRENISISINRSEIHEYFIESLDKNAVNDLWTED